MKTLCDLAARMGDKPVDRITTWRAGVRDMDDEAAADLWLRTPDDLAFALLERFLPRLFELDEIADRLDPSRHEPGNPGGVVDNENNSPDVGGGGGGGRPASSQGSPEEQDLFAFLTERPYYFKSDRREAAR